MKIEKILAKNDKGEGLLPMKQGKEQESKKTDKRKAIELCNFIKNAFCITGDVELVLSDTTISTKIFFKCKDKRRGNMWVAIGDFK